MTSDLSLFPKTGLAGPPSKRQDKPDRNLDTPALAPVRCGFRSGGICLAAAGVQGLRSPT